MATPEKRNPQIQLGTGIYVDSSRQNQGDQQGPKFRTWSKMEPKCQNGPQKSRFCLQVPIFLFYLQMLLERGGTLDLVIAVPYTDILSVSCAQSQFLGPLCLWQCFLCRAILKKLQNHVLVPLQKKVPVLPPNRYPWPWGSPAATKPPINLNFLMQEHIPPDCNF